MLLLAGCLSACSFFESEIKENAPELWYDQPAQEWMQSLPVGNGRLGAMVYGGITEETIALNEITLWSGEVDSAQEQPFGKEKLAKIRQLFFDGKIKEGNEIADKDLIGFFNTYGTHLPFGDLLLDFQHKASPENYRRSLDLSNALAKVSYTVDDVHFTREVFCSNPDQVLVVHLKADKKKSISLQGQMKMLRKATFEIKDNVFLLKGQVDYPKFGKGGVDFAGQIQFKTKGGCIVTEGESIRISDADEVTILIDINTNLTLSDPEQTCLQHISTAGQKDYKELRQKHIADFSNLFNRVELSLGTPKNDLPTDERLKQLKNNVDDPDLMALFMQYGRYLLISCSREDSPLPANLQGLWNDNLACSMMWTCDYHLDINTEQNYWLANVGHLPECNAPLFDFVDYLAKAGSKTAENVYGSPGWVAHTVANIWGFTSPGLSTGWGVFPTAGVWLASHLWSHYIYTGDTVFLQKRAYPVLKESARFMLDYMVVNPNNGYLMTGPSTSPENTFGLDGKKYPLSMMPTCDNVLVHELFTSCLESAKILDCDEAFRDSLQQSLAQLPPLKIGSQGQLQEWFEDYDEPYPHHRHTTHLLALYPFNQVSVRQTPELAEAAAVTIERRVNHPKWEDVEWSRANMINFYARLREPEKALQSVKMLMTEAARENMLTISAKGIAGAQWDIFVLDGNEAGAAGITEMLLQSQEGYIELLPVLPPQWNTGHFKGLCVRGGGEIDAEWSNGIVQKAVLRANTDNTFRLKIPGNKTQYRITKNKVEIQPENQSDILSVLLKKGETIEITQIQ
jgi:alpha-L-fucosidase 2